MFDIVFSFSNFIIFQIIYNLDHTYLENRKLKFKIDLSVITVIVLAFSRIYILLMNWTPVSKIITNLMQLFQDSLYFIFIIGCVILMIS